MSFSQYLYARRFQSCKAGAEWQHCEQLQRHLDFSQTTSNLNKHKYKRDSYK